MTEQIFTNVLWFIALPSTLIFLLMVFLTFMGIDGTDVDVDFNGDMEINDGSDIANPPVHVFTLKNMIGFLMGLGWGGLMAFKELHQSEFISILIGVGIGLVIVALNVLSFFLMAKLNAPNTVNMKSLIGQVGTVYLTIPISGTNKMGKVTVTFNGALRELNAVTIDDSPIPMGYGVEIIDILANDTLIVTKHKILNN